MAFTYGTIWNTLVPGTAANMNKDLCGYGLYSEFPAAAAYVSTLSPGNAGMIAHATDRNLLYRSSGSAWVCIGVALPSGSAAGDIDYFDGTVWQRLPKGTDGMYLKQASGLPSWAAPPSALSSQNVVTGSRAINGTVYHNTGSLPIFATVTLYLANNGGAGGSISGAAYCDSSSSPSTDVAYIQMTCATGLTFYQTLSFIVLPGYYYKIDYSTSGGSNVVLVQWVEWS